MIDTARRTEWLRALRIFKTGIRARAKLGVLDAICKQVADERNGPGQPWEKPYWDAPQWQDLLYYAVTTGNIPTHLLKGFVQSAEVMFMAPTKQPTVHNVLLAVDVICNRYSKDMRTRFGVFIDGQHKETSEEVPSETNPH